VPHLNKSLARFNQKKKPFYLGFLTVMITINLYESVIIGRKILNLKSSNRQLFLCNYELHKAMKLDMSKI